MNTTSATMNRAPSRSGIAWKVTLILIPVMILTLFLQRYIVRGLTLGAFR